MIREHEASNCQSRLDDTSPVLCIFYISKKIDG